MTMFTVPQFQITKFERLNFWKSIFLGALNTQKIIWTRCTIASETKYILPM